MVAGSTGIMNKKAGSGIAFICVGIALTIVFKNSAIGMSSGFVFIVLGVVTMIRNRNSVK